jgi:transketolase
MHKLEQKSRFIRKSVLKTAYEKGISHFGGTFSCTDLLVALYYANIIGSKDKFILSKGHACLALYVILVDLGILDESALMTYGQSGGLGAQLDINTPGIDWNTGSLGHSVGVCSGFALGAKIDKNDFLAYTIVGDAEITEGSVWEAFLFAGKMRLSNLIVIIDRNRLSVTEKLDDDTFFGQLPALCSLLNWHVQTIDGHDFAQILAALDNAKVSHLPNLIIANTIKGKGVSFMENNVRWHHGAPNESEMAIALQELSDG